MRDRLIKIQKPKKGDFGEIYLLIKQLWPHRNFDKKKLNKIYLKGLFNERKEFLIAKYNEKIVGFVSLSIRESFEEQGKVGLIDELIVDKDFQGKGFGKKLLKKMINVAKNKSCKSIELFSAFHRKIAHHLYRSNRFKITDYFFFKRL